MHDPQPATRGDGSRRPGPPRPTRTAPPGRPPGPPLPSGPLPSGPGGTMPPATRRPPGGAGRLPSARDLPVLGPQPRFLRPAVLNGTDAATAVRVATTAVRWIEEVECGRRPTAHLRTLLRPGLAERWTLVARLPRRPGRVRSAGRLQIQRFGPEPRCDLVVLVAHGARVLPTGLRLVASAGRWTVTDLARPGAVPLPQAPEAWEALLDGS